MIYDLDKIDSIRFDRKKTITLYIYDINVWNNEKEIKEHIEYAKKKIELYVNYILSGNALNYFKLTDDKNYSYVIEFVPEPMQVPITYVNMLDDCANQIYQNYGNTIFLDTKAFKCKENKKSSNFFNKFFNK